MDQSPSDVVVVNAGGQTVRSSDRCFAWPAELGEPGEHCHCLWQAVTCVRYMQLRAPEFSDDFQIYLFIYLAVPGLCCSMWGL